MSGERTIDIAALRSHVTYERGFCATHPTVEAFWEVVQNRLSKEQLATLLLFWSGSSVPPPFGFVPVPGPSDVDAEWTIARSTNFGARANPRSGGADSRAQELRLPEASTCDRRLSLPEYSNADVLFTRLTTALALGCVGYDRV